MKSNKTKPSFRAGCRLFALVGPILLLAVLQPSMSAEGAETVIKPSAEITVAPAQIRTQGDMEQAEATRGPLPQPTVIPLRPTISDAEYKQLKAAAAAEVAIFGHRRPIEDAGARPLAPPTEIFADIEGVNQTEAGGGFPPDTHGAAGLTQFVEITNSQLDVYLKTAPFARVLSVSLASFFGYTAQTIFDPRVVYDSTWNRWVITAEAFPESPTVQLHFIAISRTSDATGPYFIYSVDVNVFDNDDLWDYPQLGMDQDSIIITANIFGPEGSRGARMFAVAKARLYNGLAFSVPVFSGLVGTLAPPIVLDQNFRTFLVAAPLSGTTITKYTLENSSRPNGTTLVASTITVPAYSPPAFADQPGTTELLDTLDARFVNAGTQNGDSLWQVHTIATLGLATPRFYEFDTATNTIIQRGNFFRSDTSHDWNASIVANADNDVYVTWTATDTPLSINAQVRFSGRRATDPPGVIGPRGTLLFTSPTALTGNFDPVVNAQRWGDYSAVTVDPEDPNKAWIVNEKINDSTTWGSRLGHIGF